jgi:hypothetical protein
LTAPSTPGQATTNATLAALSDSLLALQANLQQTLPVLMLFNDNFDFVNLADNTAAPSTANPPGNFSANLGTNFASNFAVNAAVPTGPSLINSAPTRSTTIPVTAASQGFGAVPINRDALRALLVLQNDIQRMLPVLNALNGGTTNFPGSFSNLVGVVPHSP